jgi:hypothetical protein
MEIHRVILNVARMKAEAEIDQPDAVANADVSGGRITMHQPCIMHRRKMVPYRRDRVGCQSLSKISLADMLEVECRGFAVDIPNKRRRDTSGAGLAGQPCLGRRAFAGECRIEGGMAICFREPVFPNTPSGQLVLAVGWCNDVDDGFRPTLTTVPITG